MLRRPKVLLMDEATASVDNETDSHIQEIIRLRFQESTVLVIAHRINTIMDSDKILVLDAGNIIEFDSPQALLDRDSVFAELHEASLQKASSSTESSETK